MRKYLVICLGILSISLFLLTSELKAATFTSLNTAAASDDERDKGYGGSPCG